jgi:hypothetical protein
MRLAAQGATAIAGGASAAPQDKVDSVKRTGREPAYLRPGNRS